MEIFKHQMFRIESVVILAFCTERVAHLYKYLHNAYGNKWLMCLPIYSLQQIINLGSHRTAHIPFGSSFLKELRMMLKTQQFFYRLAHSHATYICRLTQRTYFVECPQLFMTPTGGMLQHSCCCTIYP